MSTLFKNLNANSGAPPLSDAQIKKMASLDLWQGNTDAKPDEIKEKWKDIIGQMDAETFWKRLAATVATRKEYVKRVCKVDPDQNEQFETDLLTTLKALASAFTYN